MEFTDLPDEIIIIIAQFIEPKYEYRFVSLKRCYLHFSALLSIYDLVCTCKRFNFLRNESFLIFDEGHLCDYHMSVNYLGFVNGPCYIRYRNKWFGYEDKKIVVVFDDVISKKYINLNYEELCSEMYQNFGDQEILKFIHECENRKNMQVMLIRKRFPELKYEISQLEQMIKSHLQE